MYHKENSEWLPSEKEAYIECFAKLSRLSLRVNIETEYCVFLRYSGHVNDVEFQMTPTKDNYQNKINIESFLNRWPEIKTTHWRDDVCTKLELLIDILEHILDSNVSGDRGDAIEVASAG